MIKVQENNRHAGEAGDRITLHNKGFEKAPLYNGESRKTYWCPGQVSCSKSLGRS